MAKKKNNKIDTRLPFTIVDDTASIDRLTYYATRTPEQEKADEDEKRKKYFDFLIKKEKDEPQFNIGEYANLIVAISDGYTPIGDYNVIFPPPTIVRIVDLSSSYYRYGVMVIKEAELPENLKGKQFRTFMASRASDGDIKFVGQRQAFFDGDDAIDEKYFSKVYWEPESYLEKIENV
jgi:hypothetical protein